MTLPVIRRRRELTPRLCVSCGLVAVRSAATGLRESSPEDVIVPSPGTCSVIDILNDFTAADFLVAAAITSATVSIAGEADVAGAEAVCAVLAEQAVRPAAR